MSMVKSLKQIYPGCLEMPILLFFSLVFLLLGLYLPVITLKELIIFKDTFSVLTGIFSLVHEEYYILAAIIFLFSIIFPFLKLMVLLGLWYYKFSNETYLFLLHWMGKLGKWSMLDVFVVAMTIVIAKISKFASAKPRIGIYFFGLSIVLTMIATMRVESLTHLSSNKEKGIVSS